MTETTPASTAGHVILDEVAAAIRTYCVLPSDDALHAVTLWCAYTHQTTAYEYAPRLVVRSPEKRSGKSRLIEIVDPLCHDPLRAVNATVAYIFRSLDRDTPPTLLIDEADTIFGSKKVAENNEELRGLLNAGFQRGLTFGRTVGPNHEPREFATFAPAALAGIGRMPDTIEDRAVVVAMRRRKPSETVQSYRTRRDRPRLDALAERLAIWAASTLDDATGYEPPRLGVDDRAADVWEPLVTVADMAGGEWPERARNAALRMTKDAEEDDLAASINTTLLADIRAVFEDEGVDFIKSQRLCERLRSLEESPWNDWELNPSRLGRRLRDYGVKTSFRDSSKTERGYQLRDFHDAFERHLAQHTRPKPSEAVRTTDDLQERSDTFKSSDTFKASDEIKASDNNPRSDAMRTPSDTFGRHDGVKDVSEVVLGVLNTSVGVDARTILGSYSQKDQDRLGLTLDTVQAAVDNHVTDGAAMVDDAGKFWLSPSAAGAVA